METAFVRLSEDCIKPTQFCDADSELIRRAALNITRGSTSPKEKAIKIFYWVRDNIRYELGLASDKASETLVKGGGSCTNKSNLVVALLRSLGIPAGFHVMEVKTRLYLGAFFTPRFNQFAAERSLHIYCAVNIDNCWIKIDPADDVRLSNAIQHLCFQATEIHFDGENDARIQLDPDHVLSDSGELLTSVDHLFRKSPRVPPTIINLLNLYLEYLRQTCIWNNNVDTVVEEFLLWVESERPALFASFQMLCGSIPNSKAREIDDPVNTENIRSNSLTGQA